MPRSISNPEGSTGIEKRSRLVTALEIAALAGGLVLAAACSSESTTSESGITSTTTKYEVTKPTPKISMSPEQKRRRAKAESYIKSDERNESIGKAVQSAGAKIVRAAVSGKLGRSTFVNARTGNWSLGAGNEGWGKLIHNPIDGGKLISVSVTVYQNADGTFALEKGVQELMIGSTAGPSYVKFESPDYGEIILDEIKDDAWEVAVTPGRIGGMLGDTAISNELEAVDTPASSLKTIDMAAVDDLNSMLAQTGLHVAA